MGVTSRPASLPPPANPPGITGDLPVDVGAVIPQKLLPDEEADLKALGWQKGDPIPGNFAELVDNARRRAELDIGAPINVEGAKGKLNLQPVSVTQLPPAEQERLRNAIRSVKVQAADAQEDASRNYAHPSVAEAARTAREAVRQNLAKATQEPAAGPAPAAAEAPADETGQQLVPKRCPRCNHDLAVIDPVVVTSEDKETFVIAACTGQSFRKVYKFFDGKVAFGFRDLSLDEQDAIQMQLANDRREGAIKDEADRVNLALRYSLCLQLATVWRDPDEDPLPASLTLWKTEHGFSDLRAIANYVMTTRLPNMTVVRLAHDASIRFGSLVRKLEDMAPEPSFWKESESSPS
jgi:hypothetical protein